MITEERYEDTSCWWWAIVDVGERSTAGLAIRDRNLAQSSLSFFCNWCSNHEGSMLVCDS